MKIISLLLVAALPSAALAADTAASPGGGLMRAALSLALVVALLMGALWFVNRAKSGLRNKHSTLRLVAGTSLGTRERIVGVEVAGKWIVAGVTPTAIHALATFDKPADADEPVDDAAPHPFAARLMHFARKDK